MAQTNADLIYDGARPPGATNPDFELYVARWGDTGYHLIGPFATPDIAHDWATGPCEGFADIGIPDSDGRNNPNDDPRWQCIWLNAPRSAPIVIHPRHTDQAAEYAKLHGYGQEIDE